MSVPDPPASLALAPEQDRLARAWIATHTEPGDRAVARLVSEHGALEALDRLAGGRVPAGTAGAIEADPDPFRSAGRTLASAHQRGLRWVCPGDDEWPTRLDDLVTADVAGRGGVPPGLWVRGALALAAHVRSSVAVVGSRASTEYGDDVAGDIAAELAEAGVTVVSGAAYGIDAAAHRGALAVRGPTLAVLASGADVAYPRGHDAMLARVAGQGLVVSEAPPGDHPTKVRFLARNRLIAALSGAVVVVEAARRSGALNTLNWAAELQRPACGVPGPVTSALSAGVHHALREHRAELVTNAAEVLELLAPLGSPPVAGASGWDQGEHRPLDGLDPLAYAVLEALPAGPSCGAAAVADSVGISEGRALVVLGDLLATGLAERTGDGWRVRVRARRGGLPAGEGGRTLPG